MQLNKLFFSKYDDCINSGSDLISLIELSFEFEKLNKSTILVMWSELFEKMKLLLNKAETSKQERQFKESELDHINLIEHLLAMRNFLMLLQQNFSEELNSESTNADIFNKHNQQILFQQVNSEISVTYCNLGFCLSEMNGQYINKQAHAFLVALQYDQYNEYAQNNVLYCLDMANSFYSAKYVNRKRTPQYEEWAKYQNIGYDLLKAPFPPGTSYRNWEGALYSYKRAIQVCPDEASSYHGLGLAYYGLGLNIDAINAWLKVIGLQPDYDFESRGFANLID